MLAFVLSFYTQEDEDRFREGEGEEGGEEENMINILGIQPIPAFCSRCVLKWCIRLASTDCY